MESNKTIWVVDDDKNISEAIQIFLTDVGGYHVELFHTEEELLEQLQRTKPDLLIMDIILDKADGRELAKVIKESHYSQLPIILMSASHQVHENELKEAYLIDKFISKPFDLFELTRTANELLNEPLTSI